MKVYKFYKINPLHREDIPVLYAFTNKKDYANQFRKERDMSIFECIVSHMTKKEYEYYLSKFRIRELAMNGYYTKIPESSKRVTVKVLTTYHEQEQACILSDQIIDEIGKHLFNPKIFESKYLYALNMVRFVDFYVFYRSGYRETYDYFYNGMEIPKQQLDGSSPLKVDFDELGLLLKFFGYTFKDPKKESGRE